MPRHAVAFLATYVLATGALMFANTAWLGQGDVKFGSSGWGLYWPLWAAFYLPVALAALGIAWRLAVPAGRKAALLWTALPVILGCMEVSFLLDIAWPVLLIEWVGLAWLFRVAGAASQVAEPGAAADRAGGSGSSGM